MDIIRSGQEACEQIRSLTASCILSFSCGKDSVAAWLVLREHFEDITPIYFYLVPELDFVETSLQYYESFFDCRIIRLPHPSLYRMIAEATFQPPERLATIEWWNLPDFNYREIIDEWSRDHSRSAPEWMAVGTRAADSPYRRLFFQRHGTILESNKKFFPVGDLRKDDLLRLFMRSQVRLPIDYRYFGRSFDGLDYRFLKPIKEHFPSDFKKILDWFPLVDLELFRGGMAYEED